MTPKRRSTRFLLGGLLMVALLLSGCAQPPRSTLPADPLSNWRGRLALRMDGDVGKSFFASFELSGHAQAGELLLSGPLGSAVADLNWTPHAAYLRSNGNVRFFESLDALAIEVTGTDVPIGALFQWLRGQPAQADGWQADLSELPQGRLLARRRQPAAELRLVLEP